MSARPTSYDAHPGLEFRTVAPPAADGVDPHWTAWVQGVQRGFHEARGGEEHVRRWGDLARAQDAVCRGAYPEQVLVGDNPLPVATFMSWDQEVNVGDGRMLPLHMITDVTVAPTHRRQGLLSTLMGEDLRAAADAGLPLAALTVSEGSIYGRFGFGVSTRLRKVEVDTGPRFAMHPGAGVEVPGGRLEMVEPADLFPVAEKVFARVLATTRGAIARPAFYEPILSGAFDFDEQGPNKDSRAVVHVGADGEPDGYVFFKVKYDDGKAPHVRVGDIQAADPAVWLRLWQFLAGIDLTTSVHCRDVAVDDPLLHAVADPWLVRTVEQKSLIWLRVLDVEACLTRHRRRHLAAGRRGRSGEPRADRRGLRRHPRRRRARQPLPRRLPGAHPRRRRPPQRVPGRARHLRRHGRRWAGAVLHDGVLGLSMSTRVPGYALTSQVLQSLRSA